MPPLWRPDGGGLPGERVEHYCTGCEGLYGNAPTRLANVVPGDESDDPPEYGRLGAFLIPPSGLAGRTPEEVFRTAVVWGSPELRAVAGRICPRCTAPLDLSLNVCRDHDSTDGLCDQCHDRHAVKTRFACTNCPYEVWGASMVALLNDDDVLAFSVDRGINPVEPSSPAAYNAAVMDYDEELRSVDPFEARFTMTVDGDALTITVDDDLTVVGVDD